MSTGRGWRVEITRPAARDAARLDKPVRERVLAAIGGLESDSPAGDIRRLAAITPPHWRLRAVIGACASTAIMRPGPS